MIADEVAQNSRAPTNSGGVARAGGVQQYSDTLKGRGPQDDQPSKDLTFLLGIAINHQDALGLTRFRVDQDPPSDAIGFDAEPPGPGRKRQWHRNSRGMGLHIQAGVMLGIGEP